jgi:amidase/aspartyl-tRNA(Asn)/glutamyl-tRNA(Gln) amidotransferase subunit A
MLSSAEWNMNIFELAGLNNRTLTAAYKAGDISPVEVLATTLTHTERVNPQINALFHVATEEAMAMARASEARWRRGAPMSALDGVPVTIKDSINMTGWPYFHGARPNRDLPPAREDSPPAARLKEAGAVIFAKTVMPDCGLLGAGVSSSHGIVRNPWRLSANTGGSSAGAGASLAAGLGLMSVGSDIAGSVRLPAGHCGLAALKPTQGLIPHLASDTMRSAGPMARSVLDVAAMLSVLALPDSRDCWSLPPSNIDYAARLDRDVKGLKIGLLLDMGFDPRPVPEVIAVVKSAARHLEDAGAHITEVSPPFDYDAYDAIDRILQIRGHAEIQSFAPDRRSEVTPAVYNWSAPGGAYSTIDHANFLKSIAASRMRMEAHIRTFDYVLSPILPVVNFPAEAPGAEVEVPLRHANFTALFNQTTQPASAVHQSLVDGLPVGVQVSGKRFDDLGVLQISHFLEQARGTVDWPLMPRN